jgi:hypothetical protein
VSIEAGWSSWMSLAGLGDVQLRLEPPGTVTFASVAMA